MFILAYFIIAAFLVGVLCGVLNQMIDECIKCIAEEHRKEVAKRRQSQNDK